MSTDGNIVRALTRAVIVSDRCNALWELVEPAEAALARLEAAEARLGVEAEMHEAATEECREWQDAARTWQDNFHAAEAQRDALAGAIRTWLAAREAVREYQRAQTAETTHLRSIEEQQHEIDVLDVEYEARENIALALAEAGLS